MQEARLSEHVRHCCYVDARSALLKPAIKLLQPAAAPADFPANGAMRPVTRCERELETPASYRWDSLTVRGGGSA